MTALKEMKNKGYTFNKEFCGYPEKRYVVRFRGEFISSHTSLVDAGFAARTHDLNRHESKQPR